MFKKMFAALVMTSVMSASAMAVEFNPMAGINIPFSKDDTQTTQAPAFGLEAILDNGVLVGMSYTSSDKEQFSYGIQAKSEHETMAFWGGKKFDNGFAAKLGYANTTGDYSWQNTKSLAGPEVFDVSIHSVLVGGAYHMDNGVNFNVHVAVPVSGDVSHGMSKGDFVSTQIMLGYRF